MNSAHPDSVASHLGRKHQSTCQDKVTLLANLYLIIVSISPEEYMYVNALIVYPIPKLKKKNRVKNIIIINMVLYIQTSSITCNNISAVKNNLSMPY